MRNDTASKILMVLWEEKAPVSSRGLALRCGISANTVRKEISQIDMEIRKHGLRIESKTSVGHYLKIVDPRAANVWMSQFRYLYKRTEHLTNQYPDDVKYLLRRLLCAGAPVSQLRLCEELYCSQSTLRRILEKVKGILETYGLTLINRRGDGLWVSGKEWDLRQCLIYQKKLYTLEMMESQKSRESGFSQTFFMWDEEKLYEQIYQKIVESLNGQNDFTIPFLYVSTIVNYIFLAVSRAKKMFDEYFTPEQKETVRNTKEFQFAERLYQELPERLAKGLRDADIMGIAVFLLCFETQNRNLKNLPVYAQLREEACEIFAELKKEWLFSEEKPDESMIEQFVCYLYALHNRHDFHVLSDPETVSFVRHKGVRTPDMCLSFFRYLKEKKGMRLSRFEKLGAFYLFLHMRRQERHGFYYVGNALLVSRYGADYARAMTDKIMREYGYSFQTITCLEFSEVQEDITGKYDLLITDLNAQESSSFWFSDIPMVSVDFFMGKEDCAGLEDYLKSHRREREEKYLNRESIHYTHLKSKDEMIGFCGDCWSKDKREKVIRHLRENDEYGILERDKGVVFFPVLLDVGSSLQIFVIINDVPIHWHESSASLFICYNHIANVDADQILYGILERFIHMSVNKTEKLIYDRRCDPLELLYEDE